MTRPARQPRCSGQLLLDYLLACVLASTVLLTLTWEIHARLERRATLLASWRFRGALERLRGQVGFDHAAGEPVLVIAGYERTAARGRGRVELGDLGPGRLSVVWHASPPVDWIALEIDLVDRHERLWIPRPAPDGSPR